MLLTPVEGSQARILSAEEMQDYHGLPQLSRSQFTDFCRSPYGYWKYHVKDPPDVRPPASEAFRFGHDCEEFFFTNRIPGNPRLIPESVLNSQGHRKGKSWTDWKAQQPKDALLLTEKEYDDHTGPLITARENVMKHRRAKSLIYDEPNQRKVGIAGVCPITGIEIRCELDLFSVYLNGIICDVKSAREVKRDKFERHIWEYGYFVQGAWYQRIVEQLTGKRYPFVFIVIQNRGDYQVETYQLDDEFIQMGCDVIDRNMPRLLECHQTGIWNSFTHNQISGASPHGWMKRKNWETQYV